MHLASYTCKIIGLFYKCIIHITAYVDFVCMDEMDTVFWNVRPCSLVHSY
jgi:hypothetical protein